MRQELQRSRILLLFLGQLLPAEYVVTMLEKGYKNRVVVVELAVRPSHMECLDILIVRVFKYGLIIEKQLTALNLVLQVYFEQPKFIGEATIIRIFIILF